MSEKEDSRFLVKESQAEKLELLECQIVKWLKGFKEKEEQSIETLLR